MEGEQWADIPGYVGIYQASDYGRIRSLPRFNGHYRTTGKVRKTCLMSCGHLSIQLCKQENWLAHRLVAGLISLEGIGKRIRLGFIPKSGAKTRSRCAACND